MTTIMEEDKDNQHAFWCNICKVACASAVNLQTHFLGAKHKKVENALKAHGIVKSAAPETSQPGKVPDFAVNDASQQGQTLEEQLDACRSTEPAIGLEYLYEYRTHDNYLYYECTLCSCETGLTNMFMHVVGAKHRLTYLTKHHPDLAEVSGRGSELHKKLKILAAEVEAKHGREKIQVVTDSQQLKRKYEGDLTGPNKNQRIDFTSDEFHIESAPASTTASGQGPSLNFQELKKAHAESMKQKIGGPDKYVDGFGTKKELLEYLKQFQILCEDDASFVLKVTQSFTRSLVQYRLKGKGGPEVAVAPQDSYPTQETNTAPTVGQNIYTEYPPKNTTGQHPAVPTTTTYQTDANRSGISAKPVSDAPTSAYNSAPASFPAGPSPKEVAPAPQSAQATQSIPPGSMGPLQETNKATIEFFTSIKNMDAEEVSATLNKIAASNAAFRGIDIPNVIKILSESGSLKPSVKSNKTY